MASAHRPPPPRLSRPQVGWCDVLADSAGRTLQPPPAATVSSAPGPPSPLSNTSTMLAVASQAQPTLAASVGVSGPSFAALQPSSLLDASVRSYLVYKLSQKAAFIGRADLLDAAINEYVRFMCLIRRQQVQAMSSGSKDGAHSLPLSPSRLVDLVWHAHILHTREYVAMCARHFDAKFVHHVPSTGPKNGAEREQARQSYVHTLAVYEQCFGVQAPANLWPDRSAAAADDDDCSPAACHGSPEDECNANCQER